MALFLHMVHIYIVVLITQNEIQQHNNNNHGGEYEWQRVKQVIESPHNNATIKKLLPIQLVSSKNIYRNEVILPIYNLFL